MQKAKQHLAQLKHLGSTHSSRHFRSFEGFLAQFLLDIGLLHGELKLRVLGVRADTRQFSVNSPSLFPPRVKIIRKRTFSKRLFPEKRFQRLLPVNATDKRTRAQYRITGSSLWKLLLTRPFPLRGPCPLPWLASAPAVIWFIVRYLNLNQA